MTAPADFQEIEAEQPGPRAPEIDCGTTCVAQFDAGRSVVLSAVEDLGSKIEGWDYGACGESLNCSVTMTSDLTVTVTFIDMPPQELTVNITGDGIGRVTSDPAGIDCDTGTCSASFIYGTTVTLTAVPDPATGDIFGGWLTSQMDLGSGILAAKTAQARVVTVAMEGMSFLQRVRVGDTVRCYAHVQKIGHTSMTIPVEVWVTRYMTGEELRVTHAVFTLVAVDETGKPIPVKRGSA